MVSAIAVVAMTHGQLLDTSTYYRVSRPARPSLSAPFPIAETVNT